MADAIELYNPDRQSDPFASFRFKAKAMFSKPITRDEFTAMQAQLSRIEEALQDAKLDRSHLSTEVEAVHAIAVEIGNKTYLATASLDEKLKEISETMQMEAGVSAVVASLETKIAYLTHAIAAKEIVVTPPSVVITGGPNSKKLIVATQQANSKAIFVAESSDTSVVTVAHVHVPNSLMLNSFIITEIRPGSAVIRISDNAVPVTNTATVNVTAS
jgi:hypothetical protein